MKRILSSDWLSEQARWARRQSKKSKTLTILVGLLRFKHSWAFEEISFCYVINPLLTKFVRWRPQNIRLVFFFTFLLAATSIRSIKIAEKRELGQYPAILTSRIVVNTSSLFLYWLFCHKPVGCILKIFWWMCMSRNCPFCVVRQDWNTIIECMKKVVFLTSTAYRF